MPLNVISQNDAQLSDEHIPNAKPSFISAFARKFLIRLVPLLFRYRRKVAADFFLIVVFLTSFHRRANPWKKRRNLTGTAYHLRFGCRITKLSSKKFFTLSSVLRSKSHTFQKCSFPRVEFQKIYFIVS